MFDLTRHNYAGHTRISENILPNTPLLLIQGLQDTTTAQASDAPQTLRLAAHDTWKLNKPYNKFTITADGQTSTESGVEKETCEGLVINAGSFHAVVNADYPPENIYAPLNYHTKTSESWGSSITCQGTLMVRNSPTNITIEDSPKIWFLNPKCLFGNSSALTSVDCVIRTAGNKRNVLYDTPTFRSTFAGCKDLKEIKNLNKWETSNILNMDWMFTCCYSLTSLDLSSFNTAKCNGMDSMFKLCRNLISVTFSDSFDTSKVRSMRNMFECCDKLEKLDVSSFNMDNVTNADRMFRRCTSLTNLTFAKSFKVKSGTELNNMFYGCRSLKTLDLRTLDTSAVVWHDTVNAYGFKTGHVGGFRGLFSGCANLETLIVSKNFQVNCNPEDVTKSKIFSYVPNLTIQTVDSFSDSLVSYVNTWNENLNESEGRYQITLGCIDPNAKTAVLGKVYDNLTYPSLTIKSFYSLTITGKNIYEKEEDVEKLQSGNSVAVIAYDKKATDPVPMTNESDRAAIIRAWLANYIPPSLEPPLFPLSLEISGSFILTGYNKFFNAPGTRWIAKKAELVLIGSNALPDVPFDVINSYVKLTGADEYVITNQINVINSRFECDGNLILKDGGNVNMITGPISQESLAALEKDYEEVGAEGGSEDSSVEGDDY